MEIKNKVDLEDKMFVFYVIINIDYTEIKLKYFPSIDFDILFLYL